MARIAGVMVSMVVGAALALTVAFAAVAQLKPDADQANLVVSEDVKQAGGDVSKVVLRYGNR